MLNKREYITNKTIISADNLNEIQDAIIEAQQSIEIIKSSLYPVGSIYLSVQNINPATIFGGEWKQIKDRFLLACGDTYTNGATGGEAAHTLTVDEMPSHSHDFIRQQWYVADVVVNSSGGSIYSWKSGGGGTTSASYQGTPTASQGGNQSHNNMPPYLAVYMWQRIS